MCDVTKYDLFLINRIMEGLEELAQEVESNLSSQAHEHIGSIASSLHCVTLKARSEESIDVIKKLDETLGSFVLEHLNDQEDMLADGEELSVKDEDKEDMIITFPEGVIDRLKSVLEEVKSRRHEIPHTYKEKLDWAVLKSEEVLAKKEKTLRDLNDISDCNQIFAEVGFCVTLGLEEIPPSAVPNDTLVPYAMETIEECLPENFSDFTKEQHIYAAIIKDISNVLAQIPPYETLSDKAKSSIEMQTGVLIYVLRKLRMKTAN